ncbi:MAG: cytochrome c [Alphaproteobacteria bacterium]
MRSILRLAALLAFLALPAAAADQALTVVDAKGATHSFTRAELLKHPDARTVAVTDDPAYGAASPEYRAIPLSRLLAGMPTAGADILVATATDGFVAQLPAAKALSSVPTGAVAYLAVEDPAKPWPPLKGKTVSAGPYFIVWTNPKRDGIGPEAWPYQTARLELTESVGKRYPAILVDQALPANAPERRGQALFVDACFACHKMNGAGEATVGPDLNLPMNPTEYFKLSVLPRYLRDPASVRHWADQKMPAIAPETMSDADLAAVIAYLAHMAGRKK